MSEPCRASISGSCLAWADGGHWCADDECIYENPPTTPIDDGLPAGGGDRTEGDSGE